MRTILATVGTSLRTNFNRNAKKEKPSVHDLTGFLRRQKPRDACAEANSLSRILADGDHIVFLHSDTPEGSLCAQALCAFYAGDYKSEAVEIPGLVYNDPHFKLAGLRSLVGILVERVQAAKGRGDEVLISATGGFKAEIAFATVVGMLFDAPVYYIHELFNDIIEMPAIPISPDYSLIADNEEFLEWIIAGSRTKSETANRLKGLPAQINTLLVEESGNYNFSPLGWAFYQKYLDLFRAATATPIMLSPSAQKAYAAQDNATRALFDRTFEKLRIRPLWIASARTEPPTTCLIYPYAHRDERVFFYPGERDSIYVCEIAQHSNKSYEKLLEKGVMRENYTDLGFTRWQG